MRERDREKPESRDSKCMYYEQEVWRGCGDAKEEENRFLLST